MALVGVSFNGRAGPYSARTALDSGCPGCPPGRRAEEEAGMRGKRTAKAAQWLPRRFLFRGTGRGRLLHTPPRTLPPLFLPWRCPPHPVISEPTSSSCDAKNRVRC